MASERAAYMARRGADFGIAIDGPISVDMNKVQARKDGFVRQLNQEVFRGASTLQEADTCRGYRR